MDAFVFGSIMALLLLDRGAITEVCTLKLAARMILGRSDKHSTRTSSCHVHIEAASRDVKGDGGFYTVQNYFVYDFLLLIVCIDGHY